MENNYYQSYNPGNGAQGGFNQNPNYQRLQNMQEKREIRKLGNIVGLTLIAYVIYPYFSTMFLNAFNLIEAYSNSSVFQYAYSIIAGEIIPILLLFGIMAALNKNKYAVPIVPAKKNSFSSTALWVGFGMLCCSAANYIVSFVAAAFKAFGFELEQVSSPELNSIFACILAVVATAVIPAVCEEFAMRCCTLGLVRKYGKAFGVIAVSVIFGLMHRNAVQFIFAFLCGLALGFVTVKTDSVVPAMLIHGFNNGMSVTNDILVYAFGDGVKKYTFVSLLAFWIIVGGICTVILITKKQFKLEENAENAAAGGLSIGSKLVSFFCVPGMIVPFLYLILSTILSIKKI